MRQRLIGAVGALLLAGVVAVLNFYRLPVVALVPGPAEDVLSKVKIQGRPTYQSRGELLLTSVGVDDDVPFYEALLDLADHDVRLYRREVFYPGNESPATVDQRNAVDMDQSKVRATAAALRALGYQVRPNGVRVEEVEPSSGAAGKLEPGDQIVAVDGRPVANVRQVQAAIRRHAAGDAVTITVRRGTTEQRYAITTRPSASDPRTPFVGVALTDLYRDLPVDVRIDIEHIGGPSAGLMFALSIVDKLSPEDLTAGRKIAGTGEITADGHVGAIGGIIEKMIGAKRQGVSTFLVPAGNCAEARRAAPSGLRLVRVSTLQDALAFLRQPPATASAPGC